MYRYFCDGCGMDLSMNSCVCDVDYQHMSFRDAISFVAQSA